MHVKNRLHRCSAEDRITADRVRSELGPLLKERDQPHVHVLVTNGVATLHGDVTDLATRAAVESRVLDVPGVHGLRSRLHIGLLQSDTRPSSGRTAQHQHRVLEKVSHNLRASEVMSASPVTVAPETTIFSAYDTILRHRIHHLPVVSPDGRCLVLLDLVDLARRMPDALRTAGRTPLWDPAGTAGPLSVLAETPLRKVAAQMDAACADACCVTDEDGRLLGLITARDIIAAVAGRVRPAKPTGGQFGGR